jgi:hypothetical protein
MLSSCRDSYWTEKDSFTLPVSEAFRYCYLFGGQILPSDGKIVMQCDWGKHAWIKEGKVVPLRSIEAHLGDRRYLLLFLNPGTGRGWVVSITPRPRFTSWERAPGTHCTGGWVGPRASLDAEVSGKTLCPCRRSNPGRPVRSQTLGWLSYPAQACMDSHKYHLALIRRCANADSFLVFHKQASRHTSS